jgi:hypothetical protein
VEPAAHPSNPFDDYIVTDPWQPAVADVPEIHAQAYALCCQARDYVKLENKTTSVLLHGAIGSGKTHLLARLRRQWTSTPSVSFTIPAPGILFIAHRFAPNPTMIWRQLRRSVVLDLLRPDANGSTQLHRLILRQLARARPADGNLPDWWDWMRQSYADSGELDKELSNLFDILDQECDLGRDLCTILCHLFLDRQRRDVRDWLRGSPQPDEVLTFLGMPRATEDPEDPEAQARECLLSLCRLAGRDHPLVICFDQIEALQIHPKDQAGLFAFGQLISCLHDQTNNVLIISCVQSSFLVQLREYVAGQNYNRLAKYEGSLDLLNWNQTVRLIESRLNNRSDLERQRAAHPGEPLWPLPEPLLKAGLGGRPCPAREVLSHCARLMGALPPPSLLEYLTGAWNDRVEQSSARSDSDQTDAILTEGLPMLLYLAEKSWKLARAEGEKDLSFVLEGPDGRIGLSLCNQPSLNSLAARFRRLKDRQHSPKLHKLILLRDPRLPITRSARQARNYLKELNRAGASYLQPDVEVLAALDASSSLLSDAKSGDLANAGENVEPAGVEKWLTANLPGVLRDFLEEILAGPRPAGQADADGKEKEIGSAV